VTRRLQRAPLLLAAFLSMTWGVWMGLLRLGWRLPLPWPDQLILHGPLMIGGFLGTLIGLERAVGVARPWAYAAPILTAAGSATLVLGPPGVVGPTLITAGSAVVVLIFAVVLRRQSSLFTWTMMLGATAWFIGNAWWLAGAGTYRVVFWWIGFLVLTIAGERLELNRLLRLPPRVSGLFAAATAVFVTGIALTVRSPEGGVRLLGAGLLLLSAWLAVFDIARRTVRASGVTRFTAVCLLSGYAWLGGAGVIAVTTGASMPGLPYDAMLHAVFLGFVVSMVFGHAPIVLPAVLGRALPFTLAAYVPLALLHASVAIRLVGDGVEVLAPWRAWGGLLNAAAIAAFATQSAWSMTRH